MRHLKVVQEDVKRKWRGPTKSGYRSYHLIECVCGKTFESRSDQNPKSCGCLRDMRKNKRKGAANSAYGRKWSFYKEGAKKRRIDWELEFKEFRYLISSDCSYCGLEAPLWDGYYKHNKTSCNKRSQSFDEDYYKDGIVPVNGIDRVDNNVGYTIDNCVPCCSICNRMKGDMSTDDFLAHVKRITNA